MIREKNFNVGNFCRLGARGLEIAEFVDIREAIIARYKEVYGSDIDLSTASADGVFVNDVSLIINNILQIMQQLYSNLNIETASGIYLDALCRLANITRLPATKSVASLLVTSQYTTGGDVTFGDPDTNGNTLNRITFIDRGGNTWVSNVSVTLGPGESVEIQATCTESGPVQAAAGWINATAVVMNLSVSQPNDAIVGSNVESDADLRARRSTSAGSDGTAVLESVIGALFDIAGIDDVKIYNNNTLTVQTAKDGTSIQPHDVYIVVKQQPNITIDDSTIGDIIYNKLTPGIKTTQTTDTTNGVDKSYEFIPEIWGTALTIFNQMVYWKLAKPITPQITIKLTPTQYFNESEFADIASAVIDYANNLKIGNDINVDDVFFEAVQADPLFKNVRTYNIARSNVTVASTTNPDTRYEYSTYSFKKETDGTYTLSIPEVTA